MINEARKRRYFEARRHYGHEHILPMAASCAWGQAKIEPTERLDLDWDSQNRATLDVITPAGRKVEARFRCEYDEFDDSDWLGTFTDKYKQGAVDRKHLAEHRASNWEPRQFRYWIPPFKRGETARSRYLRKLGVDKHTADCADRADFQRAFQHAEAERTVYTISCALYIDDTKLCAAAVGGVDTTVYDGYTWRQANEYVNETAQALLDEALTTADDEADTLISVLIVSNER